MLFFLIQLITGRIPLNKPEYTIPEMTKYREQLAKIQINPQELCREYNCNYLLEFVNEIFSFTDKPDYALLSFMLKK